jgi:S-(hydroxymethyl)glutathione dehydrogenase/alcohol dehydrogenase
VRGRIELPRFVDRYMAGRIKLDEYVSATMPLADVNRAFDLMHEGAAIRSVLRYRSGGDAG